MTVWWIGVIAYVVLVVPVVVVILHRLLRAARALPEPAARLADQTTALGSRTEPLRELERSPELAARAGAGIERYGRALERLR